MAVQIIQISLSQDPGREKSFGLSRRRWDGRCVQIETHRRLPPRFKEANVAVLDGTFGGITRVDVDDPVLAEDRYNPDGTLAWARCAGSTGATQGLGIGVFGDDSVVVTGGLRGSEMMPLPEHAPAAIPASGNAVISWHWLV